jgi:hypothetical protein
MTDFENAYIKGKSLEELIDDLGRPVAEPGSVVHELYKQAIYVRMAERIATPRRWAAVSVAAAAISALAATVSAVAALA